MAMCFLRTRWHVLVACIWAAIGCGFAYTFSTFSQALKVEYTLSQENLETIGIATTTVGFVTFSCGLLVDAFGARTMIVVGGLLNASAWFVYGALTMQSVPLGSPALIFLLLGLLATYGSACVTGSVFGILARTFPEAERAKAIGIAKAWVGIAAGLATTVYAGFFPCSDDSHERLGYLMFLSGLCALFTLVPLPFIQEPKAPSAHDASSGAMAGDSADNLLIPLRFRFRYLTAATLVIISLTVVVAFYGKSASRQETFAFSIALVVAATLPWLLIILRKCNNVIDDDALQSEAPSGRSPAQASSESPWVCGPFRMIQRGECWMLMFIVFSLQAGGVMLSTNLGSIVASRRDAGVSDESVVALFSATQSLGRLFGGVLSDSVVHAGRASRPAFFVALNVLMAAAYGLLLLEGAFPLYAGVMIAGWCFGSMYPALIVTVTELFGALRVSSNYMLFDGLPQAAASLSIAKLFAQAIYKRHEVHGECFGGQCFGWAYGGVIILQVLSTGMAALLAYRSRVVYRIISWGDDSISSDCLVRA